MNVIITIPTYHPFEKVKDYMKMVQDQSSFKVYASCQEDKSAAFNRNHCILSNLSKDVIFIQIDDDLRGFYKGWDTKLVEPLINHPDKYSIVSARLVDDKGRIIPMLGDCGEQIVKAPIQKAIHTQRTGCNVVCSACIAFTANGVLFDEEYLGSGWEDCDFCMETKKRFPNKDIVINNAVRLQHLGEMKNRPGEISQHNKDYFNKKWGVQF